MCANSISGTVNEHSDRNDVLYKQFKQTRP